MSNAGVSSATTCTKSLSNTTINGPFTVPAGSVTCLDHVTITGSVTVGSDATLIAQSTTIGGSVLATNPRQITSAGGNSVTGSVTISGTQGLSLSCGLAIGGNLSIIGSRSGGAGFSGPASPSPSCVTVGGSVLISGNAFPVAVVASKVTGGVTVVNNAAGELIAGDVIGGILSCSGNGAFDPRSGGNTARLKTGQCATF
jgi:hypothetical protein